MKTIRAVAVDDEPLGLARIRKALERHADVELIAAIDDASVATAQLPALDPDVLFLDIRMPGQDGFDLLASLPPQTRPLVVFVTAFDDHALNAFRVHAADYLVKPFDDDRFDEMMTNVRQRLGADRVHITHELNELLADIAAPPTYARRIRVTTDQATHFVPVAKITFLEADGNYVILHTDDAAHRIRATTTELHGLLDPAIFVRVHRGTVLNLEHLREVQPWFSGDCIAILNDGRKLKVSRRYRDDLMKLAF